MTRTIKFVLAASATCFVALTSSYAEGAYLWDINQTQSKVTLSIPDQTIEGNKLGFRNQTGSGSSWTVGNTAFLDGFVSTKNWPFSLSNPIEFNPGSSIVGLNTGNYRPNPAAFNSTNTSTANPDGVYTNTSTAPGVIGGKVVAVDVASATAAYLAFRDVNFGISSGPLTTTPAGPFTSTFNSAGLQFGISTATLDMDGVSIIILGQFIPDIHETVTSIMGTNTNPNGIVQATGLVLQMTIPLSIPLLIDIEGTQFNATLTGQIVATFVPEPSPFMMAGIGLVSLAVCARRRRLSR